MKRLLTGILVCCSLVSYSYTKSTVISEEAEKINRAEEKIMEKQSIRREKLLKELGDLEANYASREEMTEKLRMDSEVRWYRDEYREILKKYELVQNDLEKEINKRKNELSAIEKALEITGRIN